MAAIQTIMLPDGSVIFVDENKDYMLPDGGVLSVQNLDVGGGGGFEAAFARNSNIIIGTMQ